MALLENAQAEIELADKANEQLKKGNLTDDDVDSYVQSYNQRAEKNAKLWGELNDNQKREVR